MSLTASLVGKFQCIVVVDCCETGRGVGRGSKSSSSSKCTMECRLGVLRILWFISIAFGVVIPRRCFSVLCVLFSLSLRRKHALLSLFLSLFLSLEFCFIAS
ncbi:hypothetical protein MPTK1_3g02470 [Marchantia polymorpha subsp. ruderalis]|uniref:Transmembrane protein n=2 Tax=Marchantia polymorpha TaxID=3197 RepID=A0AAF6AWQ2_MARPO|nr:hypothetical protein MARPO_0007s0236 [Marchantia polymorpha]BBN04186.1 hypothetical protein Mp_3g02470 [Marchantia polymorpha subsp. ruderalis]|eukprot:PTQ47873.1 hypothetical protein MARPO_0007s0236 [Marchantia polymorpha]